MRHSAAPDIAAFEAGNWAALLAGVASAAEGPCPTDFNRRSMWHTATRIKIPADPKLHAGNTSPMVFLASDAFLTRQAGHPWDALFPGRSQSRSQLLAQNTNRRRATAVGGIAIAVLLQPDGQVVLLLATQLNAAANRLDSFSLVALGIAIAVLLQPDGQVVLLKQN